MPTNLGRAVRLADDQKMIDAVQKFFASSATLTFGSQTMTPAEIVAVFQKRIQTAKAVVDADAVRTAAVKVDRDERATTRKSSTRFADSSWRLSPSRRTRLPRSD
jgi:hypothetical protein